MRYCRGLGARKKPDRRKASELPVPKIPRVADASRETLEEITRQVQLSAVDAPEIVIGEAPAGRETLSAIAEELAMSLGRSPQNTLPYGDKISNAPGARTPRKGAVMSSAPEIVVSHSPAGRNTLSAIEEELRGRDVSSPTIEIAEAIVDEGPLPEAFEILEMVSFVVRGKDVARLSSEALRRRFVEEHLVHRLPGGSMEGVERVEVSPWTLRGSVMVRVFCRVRDAD